MEPPAVHHSLVVAASLDAREITELAETYRRWRDVLSAAVHTVAGGTPGAPAGLAARIHEVLADNGEPVPPSDIEDATMAIWLHAAASDCDRRDATTELLREPWRTFESTRTADDLELVPH